MKTWLQDHGVDDWFHQPFAWFGSRTSFKGFDGLRHLGGFNLAFYPGKQRLEEGMPFILDCAPTSAPIPPMSATRRTRATTCCGSG